MSGVVASNIRIYNATPAQDEKIRRAIRLIMAVVNGPKFKDEVIKFGYERRYSKGFFWNKKYYTEWVEHFTSTTESNQEVYDRIMTGETEDDESNDVEFDFGVNVLQGSHGGVIGYTTPGSDRTNTYAWVIRDYADYELAGHFFHEYVHRAHYDHANASDHNSAPYALGYIMERLAKELLQQAA